MAAADFRIEQGVAGIPTAFIAERGSGRPVVALLAEFDALPGLSQQAVADVNWMVPTSDLGTATWVPGTASHSWQAVAVGGTDIGIKGMLVAARTELMERRGAGFEYAPLLGDREPPLDYRR